MVINRIKLADLDVNGRYVLGLRWQLLPLGLIGPRPAAPFLSLLVPPRRRRRRLAVVSPSPCMEPSRVHRTLTKQG
eukprot:8069999-Pyramimonas_sp.AAC.1